MNLQVKQILTLLLDRLSDTSASLDALELDLAENGLLRRDAIRNRFQTHKQTTESHLAEIRSLIASL